MKIDKYDCFAFRTKSIDGCAALSKRKCEGCKTYKTRARVIEENKMVMEKLRAKPYNERVALAEKYNIKGIV